MNFDALIDRRGTHSAKWDLMQSLYGVPADDGISMWVADMDFRSPDCVQDALRDMQEHGIYGYFGDETAYRAAICWWMKNRHGWTVDPDWIFSTHGLCNAIGLILQTFTQPDDGVVLFTPVYHVFSKLIRAGGRQVVECPLSNVDGRFEMDFDAYEAQMTGREKLLILCSPHNPGGRIWSADELRQVANFCERHDLLLVADEIHHDLIYPGHKFVPMPLAAPEISGRLFMLTAASKTFNIAGAHTGNVIIPDPGLREKFAATIAALAISPIIFGHATTTAAYSPDGAAWVDELMVYLDGNRREFDDAINAIPGLRSMPMQATYLSWVDFSGTGMPMDEIEARVAKTARIAANHGPTFGTGGNQFMRFNIGTQRSRITEAVDRLKLAFSDLQ